MKKDDLIAALRDIRVGLSSDDIIKFFGQAQAANNSNQQNDFAQSAMVLLVEGIGNYVRFTDTAHKICTQLQISPFYVAPTNSAVLQHMAQAKTTWPGPNSAPATYQSNFLDKPPTILFIEAHKRVIAASDLVDSALHAERPAGELLLEGVSIEGEPSLSCVSETLEIIEELFSVYSEIQGDSDKSQIKVSYLDLGSNFQVGIRIDAKAETGINLTRFLTELFRWLTNPRAYMRERRAEGLAKEIAVFADLQRQVDEGKLSPEAANQFAARLLGCGQKLMTQRVFPTSLMREQTTASPATELLKLVNEQVQLPMLPTPQFSPANSEASNAT